MGSSIIKRKLRKKICQTCPYECRHYNGKNAPFTAIKSHSIPHELVVGNGYALELYQYCKHYDPFNFNEQTNLSEFSTEDKKNLA